MSDSRSTATRHRKRRLLPHLLLVAALGGVLLSFGVVSGFAADKATETAGSLGSYHWMPSTAEVDPNGTVEFKNSQSNPHGVVFENPPAAPSCTAGVPNDGTGNGNWSGTCTFTQSGTYKFYCPVHPGEMKGTITVSGPVAPIVTTEPATAVTQTGATLNGKVNPSGESTTYFFKYGLTNTYGQETAHEPAGSGTTALSESANVSGLTAATTYHFRLVAEYGAGTLVEGTDRTFTTAEPPGPPTATTGPASGVGRTEATLKGTVNPKGLSTEFFFNYGITTGYGQITDKMTVPSGITPVPVSLLVSGLSPKTTYHFQLVAKNSAVGGEVKGSDQSFTTIGGPIATTGEATGVTDTAATLAGLVNPQSQQTNYHFNYGTTPSYGQKTAEQATGTGTGNVSVSEPLTGLAPGTTYHFQLVAQNADGTSPGADHVFTTGPTPPPPPPAPPVLTPQPAIPPTTGSAPPETKITLKPAAKTRDRTPTIKFSATGGSASYTCSVDSKPFKACRSPFTAPALKPGKHKIRVKAVVGGVADPTPASYSFKVVAAK